MELVQKMALKGLRLREYVIRQEPLDEVARERLYQRLKRRKSRAVRWLRNFWAMPQLAMAA
jgi:hypothetical protein